MRVLMVARRYPPDVRSGTETVFENLYLQGRERHEVRLVVGYIRDRALVPAEALGVDLRSQGKGMSHFAMWRAARSEIRRFRPDVILANSIEAPRGGVPTVCIVHDLNFGEASRSRGSILKEAFYRARSLGLARVVTPSRATREALLRIGVPDARVRVVHNGVDVERFRPASGPPHDGEPGRVELAYPGRILPGKGQHIAIDAVARLQPAEKARVHLRITGAIADPVYYDQLRIQAFKQPVSFHPDVDDIVPFYQRADLVLFPTLMREGFGFTAIEAMACGRPAAWSEQPAIREATGGLGWAVPPDDAAALRDVIRALLADPERFRAVGEEGRRFVTERYAWPRVWEQYEKVLEEAVGR
jgi:glycosyltransferase involved in cell wall biosynthesis